MEDDDDFGDLYADVLRPLSAAPPPPTLSGSAPRPFSDPIPDDDDDDDEILYGSHRPDPSASYSSRPPQTLAPAAVSIDGDGDWLTGAAPTAVVTPENWDDDEEKEIEALPSIEPAPPDSSSIRQSRVSEDLAEARASDGDAEIGGLRIREDDCGDPFLGGEEKVEIEDDPFQELVIPGLSSGPPAAISVEDMKASASDDWDSDSEDDLQIVLNDNNPLPPVGVKNDGVGNYDDDDDEDGEEDLVIVTDTDQPHLPQAVEEQEWGEDSMRSVVDGEMKETGDSRKPNTASGSAPVARTGYGNHGFHPQHHSVYKYVRPSAGPVLGGPVVGLAGGPGQIRPPPTLGPILGRGRGDWRSAGIRGPMNTQKPYNSGYGLSGWANNSSMRAFGGGYDFTLPSHKTIFEVDIDGFEEKPWRYPGVDISDFFNFGLDEDKWKDYCKQLEQLRLEVTMQNKICVYESGRSQQDYDPDLPPELAPVAGHHDRSIGNAHHCRTENGIAELNDPGKEATCIPAPLPIGRAIQVEGGYSDRLPSIDTRPPRNCDIGAIIEIVLQDTLDSSSTDGALKQPEKVLGDLSVGEIGENRQAESEYSDRFPHAFNGRKRAMVARKAPFAPKGDGILPCPSESPLRYHPDSRPRNPIDSTGPFGGAHLGGRLPQETSRDRRHIERTRESKEQKRTTEVPSTLATETAMEQRDGEHDDRIALDDDSIMVEEDDMASDFQETPGDDGSTRSTKKQNLRSRVEQPLLQQNGVNDLRTTNSDNSIAKSGSSKDDQKRREGGEEVVQYGRLQRVGDSRKHQEEEERNVHRKDFRRDERHGIERNRVAPRDHSHLSRERDFISAHTVRGRSDGIGRSKELDGTTSGRQRRENDMHNTRVKEESTKRDRHDETSSRNKNRVKASEMNNKDDGLHSKKQGDVGDRRDSRHRDKDDNLVRRREVDDPSSKRKKDEENSRREKTEKEDSLHNYRSREDSNRRKRERDDGAEHRRREDESRTRGKVEERHSGNHKDDSCRQKEKEERSRLRPHEELPRHGEREGREGTKNVRTTGDKPLPGNGKNKDNMKDVIPDKDNYRKDRRRPNEQSKRLGRTSEGNDSHNKGREKQTDNERSSRHERVSSHNGRSSNASDREKNRENTKKSRDIEVNGETQGSTKRKLEDHKIDKDTREQEINDASPVKKVRQHNNEPEASQLHHSSGELEEDVGSDDENQKGGRSKLERWTSHKERDFTGTVEIIQALAPISGVGEAEDPNAEMLPVDDLKAETRNPNDSDPNVADAGQGGDRTGEDRDRHFDTVEKLKRRSERFKLPMPSEKEAAASKKPENEILPPPPPNEDPMADAEVKPERPARKRRWTSS